MRSEDDRGNWLLRESKGPVPPNRELSRKQFGITCHTHKISKHIPILRFFYNAVILLFNMITKGNKESSQRFSQSCKVSFVNLPINFGIEVSLISRNHDLLLNLEHTYS